MPPDHRRQVRRRFRLTVAVATAAAVAALGLVLGPAQQAVAEWDVDCAAPTQTYDELTMPASLNVGAGDVVLLVSGTFTGPVNSNGATFCVAAGATLEPSSINGTSALFVRGEATLPGLAAGSGASLDNEGTVTFLPQPNVNGIADVINRAGATLVVDSNVALGAGVSVTNDGTLEVTGDANFDGQLVNNESLTVDGQLVFNGTITNTAQMTVGGQTTVNADGTLVNTCRLTSVGLISNGSVSNAGVIDLRPGGFLNNGSADVSQTSSGLMVGSAFDNNGSIVGGGQYLFSGATRNGGSIAGDSAGAPIVFYDESSVGGALFDVQEGTVTNVVRVPVTLPGPDDCSVQPPPTTTTTTEPTTTTTEPTTTTTEPTTTTTEPTTTTTEPTTTTTEPTTTTTEPTTTTTTGPTTTTTEPTTSSTATSTTAGPTTTATAGPSVPGGPATVPPGPSGAFVDDGGPSGAGAGGGELPATGARGVDASTVAGLLLVVAGAALVYASRLRRQAEGDPGA